MDTNGWENADGDESEVIYADGDDSELVYADAEAELFQSADGEFFEAKGRKKGFWSRLFSKKENAARTAEHTEQKVAQRIDASIAKKAGRFSEKLVMEGVNPEVAHDAAIGHAVRITERKKRKNRKFRGEGKPKSIPRFKRKDDYIAYKRKQSESERSSQSESESEAQEGEDGGEDNKMLRISQSRRPARVNERSSGRSADGWNE